MPVAKKPLTLALAALALGACSIGPDFIRPEPVASERWSESETAALTAGEPEVAWWATFQDPLLSELVEQARRNNYELRAAGLRVLQARARRAITIGNLFPQQQQVSGSYERSRRSLEAGQPIDDRVQSSWQIGFDAAWEVDVWGRFRRAIEGADAEVDASLADVDDLLVSLTAEVAANYVQLRVIDARLALARANVGVQSEALELARVRFDAGGTSELDVHQATTLLADTESTIPALRAERRSVENTIAVLLGVAPGSLDERLVATEKGVPTAPGTVAIGIPADLLRRRPDVRIAEHRLAAQSARIGVAAGDLLPRIQLAGSIGWSAEDAGKLFTGRALEAVGGPRFVWPILNYGRIVNAVRVEDAVFEELASLYVDAVLRAEKDVEDTLAGFLRGRERVERLAHAADAANHAVDIALIQYREGAADFTRVLTAQQAKLLEEDRLASARGSVTLSLIGLYKALGGGWQQRTSDDVVPEETMKRIEERRWFGWGWNG